MPPEDDNNVDAEDLDILNSSDDTEIDNPDDTPVKEDDNSIPTKESKEEINEEEKPEETKQEDEIKEEEEPKEEISEELKPSFSRVNKKYPTFFKEFPEVGKALADSMAFGKIFPNVKTAEDVVERVEFFSKLEDSILDGNPEVLLQNLYQTDQDALNKFVKSFLPTIEKANQKMFISITLPYIAKALIAASADAKGSGNKNLEHSVKHLSQYLFNNPDPNAYKNVIGEDKETEGFKEAAKLKKELEERNNNDAQKFSYSIRSSGYKILSNELSKFLDPNNALPDFVRTAAIDKILSETGEVLRGDQAGNRMMANLWEKAKRSGYSEEDRAELIRAYLGRARKVLPGIREKVKKEKVKKEKVKTEKVKKVKLTKEELGRQDAKKSIAGGGKKGAA